MTRKWKRMTAAEGMAILQSDPDWVRRSEECEAAHKADMARRLKEIEPEVAPLIAEIVTAGVRFYPTKLDQWKSGGTITGPEPISPRLISHLVRTLNNYPAAIPIMVKHLRTAKHPVVIEIIARALTVEEARGTEASQMILGKLKQTEPCPARCGDAYDVRWALANALVVVGDASMVDEIKALIADPRYADIQARLKDALKHCERLAKRRL
jgi:hypothetical protein